MLIRMFTGSSSYIIWRFSVYVFAFRLIVFYVRNPCSPFPPLVFQLSLLDRMNQWMFFLLVLHE